MKPKDQLRAELESFLHEHGYRDKDTFNVEHQGETVAHRKDAGGLFFTFTYYWERQFEHLYYRGELVILTHLYVPTPKHMHPVCVLRIDNIIPEYIHDLPQMEAYLRALFKVEPPGFNTTPERLTQITEAKTI